MTSDSDKAYNLQFLKKSRLREGDIFTLSIGGSYIFGRLLKTKLSFDNSPFGLSNLIYIYDVRSSSPDIDYSRLTPDHLLIPPMFVSNVLWARGYAMKVANMLITKGDLLEQHCFYSSVHKTYYDESKNELTKKTEPCGEWTYVVGLEYIDNMLSDALHIARASVKK